MSSKTSKRARKVAQHSNAPVERDDGTRWIVVRDGRPVYQSYGGLTRKQAERLAGGLLEPAEIICVS